MRILGDQGEAQLELWCAAAGLTPNRCRRDRSGWDYVVDLPAEAGHPGLPLDLSPVAVTCKVQVKATTAEGTIRDVSLSNWKRMAEEPIPWFFLVLCYAEGDSPVAAYLVHVDAYHVERVLRRLRSLPEGAQDLHKRTLTLRPRPIDQLPSVDGNAFRHALLHHIGRDVRLYYQQKRDWWNELGYEEGRFRGTVTLPAATREQADEALVDFAIGLRNTLQADLEEVFDIRFGMERKLPDRRIGPGDIQISGLDPTGQALLRFEAADPRACADLAVDFYAPARVFPFLPQETWKIRYVSPYVQIVHHLNKGRLDLTYAINDDREHSLAELAVACSLLRLFESSRNRTISLFAEFMSGGSFETGCKSDCNVPSELGRLCASILAAKSIADFFGISPTTTVSLSDFRRHADEFLLAKAIITGCSEGMQFGVTVDLKGKRPARIGLPIVKQMRLGRDLLSVAGVLHGECVLSETPDDPDCHLIEVERVEVVYLERALTRRAEIMAETREHLRQKALAWLTAAGIPAVKGW